MITVTESTEIEFGSNLLIAFLKQKGFLFGEKKFKSISSDGSQITVFFSSKEHEEEDLSIEQRQWLRQPIDSIGLEKATLELILKSAGNDKPESARDLGWSTYSYRSNLQNYGFSKKQIDEIKAIGKNGGIIFND